MKHIVALAIVFCFCSQFKAVAQERPVFRLGEIEGRIWLITPEGEPLFAHGITHTTNRSLSKDCGALAKASKDLGFNAYVYDCPPELKNEMPHVEGRNYISTSTYMRGNVRFVDIFDPRVRRSYPGKSNGAALRTATIQT